MPSIESLALEGSIQTDYDLDDKWVVLFDNGEAAVYQRLDSAEMDAALMGGTVYEIKPVEVAR